MDYEEIDKGNFLVKNAESKDFYAELTCASDTSSYNYSGQLHTACGIKNDQKTAEFLHNQCVMYALIDAPKKLGS